MVGQSARTAAKRRLEDGGRPIGDVVDPADVAQRAADSRPYRARSAQLRQMRNAPEVEQSKRLVENHCCRGQGWANVFVEVSAEPHD